MSEPIKRHRLSLDAHAVFELLPQLDRIMVIVRADGFVHERIGLVESVSEEGKNIRLAGACHDAVIALEGLAGVEYDTSSVMKDKVYPRLDFVDGDGSPVVSVVGLEGLEPFEKLLGELEKTPVIKPKDQKGSAGDKEVPEDLDADPAAAVLNALVGGEPVTIRARVNSVTQQWTGVVEAVRPMRGYFNIMTKDFHLHLQAGSVSGWEMADGWRWALLEDGSRGALSIGPAQ